MLSLKESLMKASAKLYAIAEVGLYFAIFAGVEADIVYRTWGIGSLQHTVIHVFLALIFLAVVIGSIWYRQWYRKHNRS